MEFLTEEEFLEITVNGKKEVFEEVLTRVFNKAIESAMCHIPVMVARLSKKVEVTNKLLSKYFEDNPDFLKYPDIMAKAIQEIEMEFTGMSFEDVIEKAQPIIQKRIDSVKGGITNA
jgi:S-adenosylmethionine synthetase